MYSTYIIVLQHFNKPENDAIVLFRKKIEEKILASFGASDFIKWKKNCYQFLRTMYHMTQARTLDNTLSFLLLLEQN